MRPELGRGEAVFRFVSDGSHCGGAGHARSTHVIAAKFRALTRQDQINTVSSYELPVTSKPGVTRLN